MKSKQAIAALGALAQETRLDIFRVLVKVGPDGLPAGQIAERLNVPPATMSFHLMQLSRAGLVVSRRQSRLIIYAAAMDRMNELMAFLTDSCCEGHPELCAPQATGRGQCGPTSAPVEIEEPSGRSPARRRRAASA